MRNPLNSIIGQVRLIEGNADRLDDFIRKVKQKLTKSELEEVQDIRDSLNNSCSVLHSSSKLLLYNVEDILCIAQIRAQAVELDIPLGPGRLG